jgi:TonB family protein
VSIKQNTHVQSGQSWLWFIVAGLIFLFAISAQQLLAEDSRADSETSASAGSNKASRKLVHKIDPVYPQDLKRRSIGGTVKLDVKITAGGNVEKVAIVGGNPILADSAARAVKQWQYAPASASSTMLLNVEFNPNH